MRYLKVREDIPTELYHLSFNDELEGIWKPKMPVGDGETVGGKFSEPEFPRICVAPSIEQCFWALYPNISRFFEELNYPYIQMTAYVPKLTEDTAIISNQEIIRRRLVHDAHITGEVMITSPVYMKKHSVVKIANPVRNKTVMYRPFNDKNEPLKFLSHKINLIK